MTTALQAEGRACANCGKSLSGPYCATCGQRANIYRSFRDLLEELAQDVFKLDLRLTRTLPLLVFRPGKLTRDYIQGRRATYVSPIGMFLFVLFIMMFVLGVLDNLGAGPGSDAMAWSQAANAWTDLQPDGVVPPAAEAPAANSQGDPAAAGEKRRVTSTDIQDLGYKLSFLLVPVSLPFVALLFLNRRDITIFDHCVFLYYSLSFMLLLFLLQTVLGRISEVLVTQYLKQAFFIIPVAHILFQVKGGYSLSWPSAIWRAAIILFIAAFTLLLYVATLFGALMLIQ